MNPAETKGHGPMSTEGAPPNGSAQETPAPERRMVAVPAPVPRGDQEMPRPGSDEGPRTSPRPAEVVFSLQGLGVTYGGAPALKDVTMDVMARRVTAIIGPSGCGKSTMIRCLNRMNDLIPGAKVQGGVLYHGEDIYDPEINPVVVRRRIGMVFQRPNPFPKSIYDNVAFGARINGYKGDMDELVERSLRRSALWDEVKNDLKKSALALSGGQQQRLCIARAIAVEPDVILMDEPASALDPIATMRIEDLMQELKADYSIVIVTHNMQQAARVSDQTAFLYTEVEEKTSARWGILVEHGETSRIFTNPSDERTEDYVSGRFG
jgi:phosphate transport system ATP-binding protein